MSDSPHPGSPQRAEDARERAYGSATLPLQGRVKGSQLAQVLFAPKSVALVGQSNDAGKTAGRPLKYLRQAGYAGRIYPVNARRDEVLGERAWPSLASLPEVPEHVYIVAGTEAATM